MFEFQYLLRFYYFVYSYLLINPCVINEVNGNKKMLLPPSLQSRSTPYTGVKGAGA